MNLIFPELLLFLVGGWRGTGDLSEHPGKGSRTF